MSRPIGRIRSTSGDLFRRSSGRRLSGIGAAGVVIGALPAWWTLAAPGVPPTIGNAFDTPGAAGFFVAQGFAIRNRDVLYVSNAPGADLQKFTNVLANVAYSAFGLVNQVK
mgnify:CR=1 FL=1